MLLDPLLRARNFISFRAPPLDRWSSKVFDGRSRDSALVPKNAKETPGNLEGCEADERPRPDRDLDPPLELYCW